MDRLPPPYPGRSAEPGLLLKGFISLFSIALIAAVLFAGSRDWSADKSVISNLTDFSDLRTFVGQFNITKSEREGTPANQEPAMIRKDVSGLPAGQIQRHHDDKSLKLRGYKSPQPTNHLPHRP